MIKYLFSKFIQKIQLPSVRCSKVSKKAKICYATQISGCEIGDYSYVAKYCNISQTKIGKYCSVAPFCVIGPGSHPLEFISTSPVFYGGKNLFNKNLGKHIFSEYNKTEIGNDVWIGSGVYIKSGVKIGNGAVIGMGSVVTKNVGDYEIWAGNPAKLIRKRFDDEIIEKLLKINWWDFSEEILISLNDNFDNVEKFIEKVENSK